jgi:uncharacterized membrane protein YvbJ
LKGKKEIFCVKKIRIFLLGIIFIAVLLSLQACESSDDMEADRVGKELTEAIKEKNVKEVKSLFSPYACKNVLFE